jgi:hypothetical protein
VGVPPPGFSVPLSGFQFGAPTGSGPQAPRRAQPAAPPPPAPPIASGPSEAPPEVEAGAYVPPSGPAIAAAAGNEWQQRARERQPYQYRQPRQAPPQGETQLVHAWLHALTTMRIPPQACTIWLTSCEQPTYSIYIPGEVVVGEHPDRALYEYVNAQRRRKDVAERFVGRIRAPAADGSPYECGGGELYLPPVAPPAPPSPWSTPSAPWASSPYGPPSMPPPWGGPPPWWQPPGGAMGMPPWWGPSAPPLSALISAAHPQPPPAAVASDPVALKMWEGMQTNQAMMFKAFMDLAGRPAAAPAAPVAQPDPFEQLTRVIGLFEKIKGPPETAAPTVTVTRIDEDTSLVIDKNGDVNPSATAWANMKGVKGIVSALRNVNRPAGNGAVTAGPQAPRRVGAGGNGAPAKTNGAD